METVCRDIILPYELKPWQQFVKSDAHRFKVIVAGGRSGKTTLAVDWLTTAVPTDDMKLGDSTSWYVAPTYTSAEDIAWTKLKENIKPLQEHGLVRRIYEGDMSVELYGGQWIQLKGGDNPDSLRGVKLRRLVLDEFAIMKPEIWDEVLSPRTSDYLAPVMFIGTPKGFNHFHKLSLMELDPFKQRDWKTFRIKTSEAGTIAPDEIERAKRDMDPRVFRQEYEASFEAFGGQVFTDFDRNIHVPEKPFGFVPGMEYGTGMDFGWSSPSVVLFINVDAQENVYVFAEYARRETPVPVIGAAIKQRVPGAIPSLIACDPAGAAKAEAIGLDAVTELRNIFGFEAVRYRANYPGVIQDGLNVIRKWLRNKKLKISKACPGLIQAMEMYRYPDPNHGISSELPLKDGVSDHYVDPLRYWFNLRFPLRISRVEAL